MTPQDDAPKDGGPHSPPLDMPRLKRLISAYCEGSLTPAQVAELERALATNRDARALYAAYMQIDAGLDWTIRGREKLATLARLPTESRCPTPTRANRRMLSAAATLAASLLLALGAVLWSTRDRDRGGAAALPAKDSNRRALAASDAQASAAAVAAIVELSPECRWFVENRQHVGGVARAGDVIRLTRGELKLDFACGATVTMRAPAALQVLSAMQARAVLGKLTAHVDKGAEGFTVETPRTTVVDLGTDFGIDVSDHGSTDVVVFNGEVDLHYDGAAGDRSQQRLRAGEGLRVSGEGTASRIVSIVDGQYPSAAAAAERTPVISAVSDNIRRGESWHYYEIVHGGMNEDAKAFVDRKDHEWNGVDVAGIPSYLLGGDYVKTFNDDKMNRAVQIRVNIDRPAILYVLHDKRTPVPQWLSDEFFDTGDSIGIDGGGYSRDNWYRTIDLGPGVSIDDKFSIWRRDVPAAGVVELGAITIGGQQNNMYGIVAVPMQMGDGGDDFPGAADRPAAAMRITADGGAADGHAAIDGAIERPGDADVFSLPWTGGLLRITCRASEHTTLDPVLAVYDRNEMLVGYSRTSRGDFNRGKSNRKGGVEAALTMNLPRGDYYLAVTGADEVGEVGAYRIEATPASGFAPPPLTPSPSLVLTATPAEASVALSWNKLPGIESYVVERSDDGVDFVALATTTASSTVDAAAPADAAAIYRLRAGDGRASAASAPVLMQSRPRRVENLQALGRQPKLITLQWRDAPGEQAYRVERSIDGRNFVRVATTTKNACGFRDASIQPGVRYAYRVVTVDRLGDAAVTSTVEAISAVGELSAKALSEGDAAGGVTLHWQPNNPSGQLLVERESGDNGTFHAIALLPGDATKFVDRTAPAGQLVTYRIASVEDATNLPDPTADEVNAIGLPPGRDGDHFALKFTGSLVIDEPGRYDFTLNTDDGSRLLIDGNLVVDHDGCHALREASGVVDLATGAHQFELQYFEYEGNAVLEAWWTKPGSPRSEIPPSALPSLVCRSYDGEWTRLPFNATLAVSSAVSVRTPAK